MTTSKTDRELLLSWAKEAGCGNAATFGLPDAGWIVSAAALERLCTLAMRHAAEESAKLAEQAGCGWDDDGTAERACGAASDAIRDHFKTL